MNYKNLLATYLLFNTVLCFSQSKYELIFWSCENDSFSFQFEGINKDKIKIIDSENNKINFEKGFSPEEYFFTSKNTIIKIEFENIFKQKQDTIIKLDDKKSQYFICVDKFIDNTEIESSFNKCIEKRKTWKIKFSSFGCFHHNNESLEISYMNQVPYLDYKIDGILKETIILTDRTIQKLVLFEKKLKHLNTPELHCTTSDYYDVKSKFEKYKIIDSSCLWDGFNVLKKELNLIN